MRKALRTIVLLTTLCAALVLPASEAQAHGSCYRSGTVYKDFTIVVGQGRATCDYTHYAIYVTAELEMYNPLTGTWEPKGPTAYGTCYNTNQCPLSGSTLRTYVTCSGFSPTRMWRVEIFHMAKRYSSDPWGHINSSYPAQATLGCWV